MDKKYVGRFAPSPSGQLHFGSLVTAVASFLDAKSNHGTWLLRIEDIDEPRCIRGVDNDILRTLEQHALFWDDNVIYQSQQHKRYQRVIDQLLQQNLAYYCACTRKQIKAMGGLYNGHCRHLGLSPDNNRDDQLAVRLKMNAPLQAFADVIMGQVKPTESRAPSDNRYDPTSNANLRAEDVVIRRRDGLFSYNLVVILDDVFQNVSHVIRGCDLLDVTPLQRAVYQTLGYAEPIYGHIPVAAVSPGRKLSKQNRAAPVNNATPKQNVVRVMRFLGFDFPAASSFNDISALLAHAIAIWDRKKVVKTPEIIVPQHESTYYNEPS